MLKIPCVLMRGGTSKGPVLLASDLPSDPLERDAILLALMGSGHELEIDGIGGGAPQSSKVAIISPSDVEGVDIDYLFAQVMVTERRVDTSPNCGNMLCTVGSFAIEQGLIKATGPVTKVRIRNVNTNTLIDAEIQTPHDQVIYEGDVHIDGVPGTAAPVGLTFLNAAGSKTGKLFPTGNITDVIDGLTVTCIDMAMPMVFINAADVGKRGDETPQELDADKAMMQRIESIRRQAGQLMGLGDVTDKVIPKPVLVSAPTHGGTIQVRYFMPHNCHKSLAITGSIGISTACLVKGSLAERIVSQSHTSDSPLTSVTIEHPSGTITVSLKQTGDTPETIVSSVIRTARKLFAGDVYVSEINLAAIKEELANR